MSETLFGYPVVVVEYDSENPCSIEAGDVILHDWSYYSGRIALTLEKREDGSYVLETSEPIGANILEQLLNSGTQAEEAA